MAKYYDRVNGEDYYAVLRRLHSILRPKTYFEIGSRTGESVAISGCATIAIDPAFQISNDVIGEKPSCLFFQTTSDNFFRDHSPSDLFGAPIDLAFLDGLHCAEFLLRDFYNTEIHCKRNSIIILHDCLPGEIEITSRSQNDPLNQSALKPSYWAGDVWKILPILKKRRPDLKIIALDAEPTGLVMVTNLNPSSSCLALSYKEITEDFERLSKADAFDVFWQNVEIHSTKQFESQEDIWKHFWL